MSASTLLVNGKLNASYLPAGIVPENPVFESVAIAPDAGVPGVLSIENPDGDSFRIVKDLDGFVRMYQTPVGATANLIFAVDETGNSLVVSAQSIELGDATDATPTVQVIGSTGLGQVYDSKYNPVLGQDQAVPGLGIGGAIFITSPTPSIGTFTPPITGMYIFQTIFSVPGTIKSAIIDNNGLIEWYVSAGSSEILGGSQTVVGSTLISPLTVSGGLVAPIDWTYTNFCYLTAGTEYTYNITAFPGTTPDGEWELPTIVRVITAC